MLNIQMPKYFYSVYKNIKFELWNEVTLIKLNK